MTNWIKCSERMPEEEQSILLLPHKYAIAFQGWLSGEGYFFRANAEEDPKGSTIYEISEIEYWAILSRPGDKIISDVYVKKSELLDFIDREYKVVEEGRRKYYSDEQSYRDMSARLFMIHLIRSSIKSGEVKEYDFTETIEKAWRYDQLD